MACVKVNLKGNNNESLLANSPSPHKIENSNPDQPSSSRITTNKDNNNNITKNNSHNSNQPMAIDTPMRRLKRMGWYWGSISPEYAGKLLDDEQDGTFLVRDSSSDTHIFSMTFRLAGQIHHTRIEHSKGEFSFGRGAYPKLVSTTIVDFIEKAIQCSHDGDYSIFLHRDPSMEGPVKFKMIPLSRLKGGMTSLKHMSRFAILPYVRRDKISELPIPSCLVNYLYEPFY